MSAIPGQLQALEQTIVTLPDADKLWLLNLLLDQLQTVPNALMERVKTLEDTGLYQAMLITKDETPLSREAAIDALEQP